MGGSDLLPSDMTPAGRAAAVKLEEECVWGCHETSPSLSVTLPPCPCPSLSLTRPVPPLTRPTPPTSPPPRDPFSRQLVWQDPGLLPAAAATTAPTADATAAA